MKMFTLLAFFLISFSSYGKVVLVVLSGESKLTLQNGNIYKTGFYLNELMVPVMELIKNDYKLVFATPKGNPPSLDKDSDDPKYFTNKKEYLAAKKSLKDLNLLHEKNSPIESLEKINKNGVKGFSGIFVPGGHAPMIDLAFGKNLGEILKKFNKRNIPTALVCHGPVALLSTLKSPQSITLNKKKSDDWTYKGYKMTVFSDSEEDYAEKKKLNGKVPFYPESSLRRAGGKLVTEKNWVSNIVIDRELITGQNPASDIALVQSFIKMMESSTSSSGF